MNKVIKKTANAEIASVCGRFYAMDRENNLDRTTTAIRTMFNLTNTKSNLKSKDIDSYLKSEHSLGISDEYIHPISIDTKEDSRLKKR